MAVNSIYRISVEVEDIQELDLTGPPISVAPSRNGRSAVFDLWYEHYDQTDSPPYEPRMGGRFRIFIFGTGHPVPWTPYTRHAWRHIGTVITPNDLVWHIYVGPAKGQAIGL